MRPVGPTAAVVAFALGALAADATTLVVGLVPPVALWIGGALGRPLLCLRPAALVGLFVTAGVLRAWPAAQAAHETPLARPERATLVGRVSRVAPGRIDLAGVHRVDPGPRLPRRLRLYDGGEASPGLSEVAPGWLLRVRARVGPTPPRRNPGGIDRARQLASYGIGGRGWLLDRGRVVRETAGAASAVDTVLRVFRRARARAVDVLRARGQGGALLAALSLGARDPQAPSRDAFRALGLSHLLAISGLHLALVGWTVHRGVLALRLRVGPAPRGDPRVQSLLVSCLATAVYAALSGGALPVRRAWIMWCVWAGACCLRRPSTRFAPLVLAAGILAVSEPAVLVEPGAQLSFAACAALLLGSPGAGAAARSAEVIAGTAPVAAVGIGVLSPWAWLANLVAVPWTAFVLLPAALVAAGATLCPAGVREVLLELCTPIGAWSVWAVISAAEALPPPLRVAPSVSALAVASVLVVAVLRVRSVVYKAAGAIATPLVLALGPTTPERPSVPRAVVLDVGQGDASLVQGRGGAVLVDGGRALPGGLGQGRTTVLPALAALGVRRLDLVVATHGDLDHRGGLVAVLEEIPVDELWLPWGSFRQPGFAALLESARRRGVPAVERGAGSSSLRVGDVRIVPLWPPRRGVGTSNDRSLVVRVDVFAPPGPRHAARRVSVLFPGDVESAAEAALVAQHTSLRAELLVLPHHGSRTSSSPGFLRAVGPRLAIASAGRHHRFGMPHPEVRRRLRAMGVPMWHTGRHGAVWVSLDHPLWARATLPPPRLARAEEAEPASERAPGRGASR